MHPAEPRPDRLQIAVLFLRRPSSLGGRLATFGANRSPVTVHLLQSDQGERHEKS
jgi:hypothetical protein